MGLLSHVRGEGKHFFGFGREGGQLENLRLDRPYKNNMGWRGLISYGSGKG